MFNFVGVFAVPTIKNVLYGFVVWGSEKLFLGILRKIKKFFLQITQNGEDIKNSKKISKNLIF
jgi:hypothetical protein